MDYFILLKSFLIEISIFLYVFTNYFSVIIPNNITKIFLYIYIFLLIFLIFLNKYSKKEILLLFLVFILLMSKMAIKKETSLILLFCTIVGFKDYLKIKWIKKNLIYAVLCFFILIIYFQINDIGNIYIRGNGTIRYDLGFKNPNILAKICFSLLLMGYFFIKNKIYSTIFIGSFSFVVYQVTKSRTFLCVTLFLLFFNIIMKKILKYKIVKIFILNFYIILYSFSIYLVKYLYNNSFINKLLSYRLSYYKWFLENINVNLLGNNLDIIGNETFNALDSSYIFFYLQGGLLISLIFYAIYYKLFSSFIKKQEYKLITITISILIYSLFENNLTQITFNFTLLYLFDRIYKEKNGKIA